MTDTEPPRKTPRTESPLRIPAPLRQRYASMAADRGISINALFTIALREWIDSKEEQ